MSLAHWKAAAASLVLASKVGVLPLDPVSLRRLAAIKPNAADTPIQHGGICEVLPHYSVSVLEALKMALLGTGVSVDHAVGARIREVFGLYHPAIATCVVRAAGSTCSLP